MHLKDCAVPPYYTMHEWLGAHESVNHISVISVVTKYLNLKNKNISFTSWYIGNLTNIYFLLFDYNPSPYLLHTFFVC